MGTGSKDKAEGEGDREKDKAGAGMTKEMTPMKMKTPVPLKPPLWQVGVWIIFVLFWAELSYGQVNTKFIISVFFSFF